MSFIEREEHDACGIVAWVDKAPMGSRNNVLNALSALNQMRHRAGFVSEEGDGCGILVDLPRGIWADHLSDFGHSPALAHDPGFAVAHLICREWNRVEREAWTAAFEQVARRAGFRVLGCVFNAVNRSALGPGGQAEDTGFVQVALYLEDLDGTPPESACFGLQLAVEDELGAHAASLSTKSVVYKARGDSTVLQGYFDDFRHPAFISRITIGHNRYSTNTTTSSERVQPFSLLGHNGEINTIHRLREEAGMIGVKMVPGGSDSQDLNRLIESLRQVFGYSLLEAMELAFPPIINEIKQMRPELQDLYMFMRTLWGPFAQGPAAIVARADAEAVFAVDAMGLRPLWMVETDHSLVFSSEQGVVPLFDMIHDPRPLAPGEKVYIQLPETETVTVYSHAEAQEETLSRMSKRHHFAAYRHGLSFGGPAMLGDVHLTPARLEESGREARMAAFGWDVEDVRIMEHQASNGAEPIRSLGFDGPLAALAEQSQNVADFLKETVAVVTNPAIDREREIEHFSTRVVLGRRPTFYAQEHTAPRMELQSPILLGGHDVDEPDRYRALAHKMSAQLFEDAAHHLSRNPGDVAEIYPRMEVGETLREALQRLRTEIEAAVADKAVLLLLDDRLAFADGAAPIDPALVVGVAHGALREVYTDDGESQRRTCNIVVRSGAIRNLHDIVVLIGLGAEAVCPYLYLESAYAFDGWKGIENTYTALVKGLEKVLSTLGIHELRGYDRLFSGIGLADEVAALLDIRSFFGGNATAGSLATFEATARTRTQALREGAAKLARPYQLWPRIWKAAGDAAVGKSPYGDFAAKLRELEVAQPISLRHLLDVAAQGQGIDPEDVDLTIGEHELPFVISSMSFGSQGETAFRAYAMAAARLDMIAMNGEGGEIKDMLGKFAKNRGHQIASGRFGVNAELCNSADLLEIKIGQGAKPGEGGHLPGSKVSAKVANARNARQGTDLISPSNNHDIYSIEDLAQMIDELKTVNPRAKVAVKVPVVPGIGTIAVGIAKAGADVITLSGFDGGTGAARAHALRHVGLPVEIGVKLAHEALLDSGLRQHVEVWCDGGVKSGLDVVKMLLLGANRVGFGTMAMIAIGCTGCRGCHKDTCHVGIATQIETVEQAQTHGLKAFAPRELETATAQLCRYFEGVASEARTIAASLGASSLQSLVGQSQLLVQTRGKHLLELDDLVARHSEREYLYAWAPARPSMVGKESLTAKLGAQAVNAMAAGNETLSYGAVQVHSGERVIGGMLSGSVVRSEVRERRQGLARASVQLQSGSVAGNGFGAYNAPGVLLRVEGGAQDGVGKSALGGKIVVLKGLNRYGSRVGGCVGKCVAYGAQRGLFIVQGAADARAGIRLSGADVIIGGELSAPLDDSLAGIADRASVKGFAFEYMTGGRALVLGDPGPWICSGMTGGVVYLRLQPELGLTQGALRRRLAKGAKVALAPLRPAGVLDVQELLGMYQRELTRSGQQEAADRLTALIAAPEEHFMAVLPGSEQTDQDVATE